MSITHQKAQEIFDNHPTRFTRKEKAALRSTLRSELKKMGYDEKALEKDFSSGDFSKSPARRELLFYLDLTGGQPGAWTSIGPLLLRKKLEY